MESRPDDLLCTACWGGAKPFYVDGLLDGWLCDCGHYDKAVGRERLFIEPEGQGDESNKT